MMGHTDLTMLGKVYEHIQAVKKVSDAAKTAQGPKPNARPTRRSLSDAEVATPLSGDVGADADNGAKESRSRRGPEFTPRPTPMRRWGRLPSRKGVDGPLSTSQPLGRLGNRKLVGGGAWGQASGSTSFHYAA